MRLSTGLVLAGAAATVLLAAGSSMGALSQSQSGPGLATYTNGGGTGFGGTLGAGSVGMQITGGNNLTVTFNPGSALNDLVVVRLDTRNGGVGDFEMNDQADGGRRAASSPIRDGFLNEPVGMNTYAAGSGGGASDFALVIGSFGVVLFELTGGTNLNFVQFNAGLSTSIPLATLGSPSTIDWFAYYTSDSTYASNESLPASGAYNTGANPGFGPGTFGADNFNRYLVPAPSAAALLGIGGLIAGRRRRN